MAFTVPGNFSQFTPLIDRAVRKVALPEVPQNPQAGSLVIIDDFQDSNGHAAHGNVGAHAAEQHGFRGPIYAEKYGSDTYVPSQAGATASRLSEKPLAPAAARQAIERYASQSQQGLLSNVTGDLNKVRETGLHDSAINVSMGTHPQNIALALYERVRSAPTQPAPPPPPESGFTDYANKEYQFAQNVMGAYGIDQSKLNSTDSKVSGPERLRLQQGLLDAAQRGGKTDEVQQAKKEYGQAVRAVESRNNSVVVSAGNQEQVLDQLAADAGGRRVKAEANSNHNVLVNSDVTTVGATRWNTKGQERLAEYSTRDPEVDIYASGSVGNGENQNRANTMGTSFSAPRVAAMMASLHGTRPGTPSRAAENLMRNRLTHPLGQEQVLDFGKAEEYMRTGTF